MDNSAYDFYREQGIAIYIKGKQVIGIHPNNVDWTVKALDDGEFKIAWQHHLEWVLKQNSKEEFEKRYCERSEISIEDYHEYEVTLPCDCGEDGCEGWAAVSDNPISIKAHKDLYQRHMQNEV